MGEISRCRRAVFGGGEGMLRRMFLVILKRLGIIMRSRLMAIKWKEQPPDCRVVNPGFGLHLPCAISEFHVSKCKH